MTQLKVAILGASGYTGAELVRLLAHHPQVSITVLTADRKAGQVMGQVFPHLASLDLPSLVSLNQVDFTKIDLVFCALPHGTTQAVIAALPSQLRVVDLSADFRLYDVASYEQWYGQPHTAVALQKDAVYGLTELARGAVAKARLVANPGCYPTSVQLPLIPLLRAGVLEKDDIIVDSKSAVSGAGRSAREPNLFCEAGEGIRPYGIANHRHLPEIEQGLSQAAKTAVFISFTPHLIPMNRGILSTIYAKTAKGAKARDLRNILNQQYADDYFVTLLEEGQVPSTRHVSGSNHCLINVFDDRRDGRVIITSVIDNLLKGASGQAIQNMNVMYDFPETLSLEQLPLFP